MASAASFKSEVPAEQGPSPSSTSRSEIAMSSVEKKVESVVGINIASLQQELLNEGIADDSPSPELAGINRIASSNVSGFSASNGSPSKVQGQGQHFEPLDKAVSQTVKLNPKIELSRPDLLKLLSYMEAELQARDVVIATLKTERIKNLLHYGRVGINDPFVALQRDNVGGRLTGSGNVTEGEIKTIEETQLKQLENLITQQRKAHHRMRQVLREAEKRHAWTLEELEKERRKNGSDSIQANESAMADNDQTKQGQELGSEKTGKRVTEKDLKKLQDTLDEEKEKQKQIILMLVEERKRLALQYVEERKRSEDLAQILSEEKGRIDAMAEGLEEESKKSLQMEAELEKQLAEFDTERQQMRAQLAKKEDRILELESLAEKMQREVEHYKKQLQEAHNVAMFQQTLSVSPPRIGLGSPRAQPPQLPAKPSSLTQGQPRLQGAPAHSNVTKAVQLTATVNSVPVTGPTTGVARGVQSGVAVRPTMFSSSTSEISRPITTTAKTYSDNESSWVESVIECDSSQPQVVQVSPRVNVSASSSNKVITTSHGGKVTFHVTTNTAPSNGQNTILKKPSPSTRTNTPVPKPSGAPPVPPNKPVIPPKKDLSVRGSDSNSQSPLSVEVKPHKVGPQTVKFGITISKTSSDSSVSSGSAISPEIARRDSAQVVETSPRMHACVDSLSSELDNFHQLLTSMAGPSDVVAPTLNSSSNSLCCDQSCSVSQPTFPSTLESTSFQEASGAPMNSLPYSSPPHSPIDVATPLTEDKLTALHLAAQGNNWQSVSVLIKCGAQVSAEDVEGRTPLYLALLYSCVTAAKALLYYPQSMEHTTKTGCNLLHAAVRSGEAECLYLIVNHLIDKEVDGMSLLRLLAVSPDHDGYTPLSLAAIEITSIDLLQVFHDVGLNLRTIAVHQPSLLEVASLPSLSLLAPSTAEDEVYCVKVKGVPLDYLPWWTIGAVCVKPDTQWTDLEALVDALLINHLAVIESSNSMTSDSSEELEDFANDENCTLGLDETAIECFSIGNQFWKKGSSDASSLPYELLQMTSSKEIVVRFRPLASVSYSCLIPVFLLENYLRLMNQSKCVVVYGAKNSGKRTLARCLAALWCESFAEDSYSKLDLDQSTDEALMISSVEESLRNGCVLVLERVPRDMWPALWSSLKRGVSKAGGRILATMDSWRRPSGQLESEVLWVQMRHDRQPLSGYLVRSLLRQVVSRVGHSPPRQSEILRVIDWISCCYSRLSDTLMSLGFSSVLRGPQLFALNLQEAVNPKDMMLGVQSVWNSILVPAIRAQVQTVWRGSPLYGEEKAPHESKVSAMALHVIFQRVFLAGLVVPNDVLEGFLCRKPRPPPRPKDLPLSPESKRGLESPTKSPEWNQDNLAKILGLSPMGYA